jgi:polysaccharide biosynthesis protein PslH
MRILQLCNKPPLPAIDGGCLAMHAVTRGLIAAGIEVKVLSLATYKHPFDPNKIPSEYISQTQFEAVNTDTEVKPIPALLSFFSPKSYNIVRFYNPDFEEKLIAALQTTNYDLVHLESVYMSPYIPAIRKNSKAKIVLRTHNAEGTLWERRTEEEKNVLKKCWFRSLTKKIKKAESACLTEVDALVAITEEDRRYFSLLNSSLRTMVLPYASELPPLSQKAPQADTVFHLASMDWEPNRQGLRWFIDYCWPLIRKQNSNAVLHLGGKSLAVNDPAFSGPGIKVHGFVENANEFMNQYLVMIVPLFSGGGMRIKLVEAMALAKTIVTTPIGAEGIGIQNRNQALIADDPENFAQAVLELLTDSKSAVQMAFGARQFAQSEFEITNATEKLIRFYQELIQ